MNAKELRIGNYLYSKLTNQIFQVTAGDIANIENDASVVEPVPLTEFWLLKFGFEIHGRRISKNWFYLWYDDKKIVFALVEMEGKTGAYLVMKYVHQVQNLYFALTGEELISTEK